MKTCTQCKIDKVVAEYYSKKSECKECFRSRRKSFYKKNREKILQKAKDAYTGETRTQTLERNREYYSKNKDAIIEQKRQYRVENVEQISQYKKEYGQRKKGEIKQKQTRRRLKERKASIYATEALIKFMQNCPKGYHVDHILPLNGKTQSGLHVLENLQYLPAKANQCKSNKELEELMTPYPTCSIAVYTQLTDFIKSRNNTVKGL